MLTRVKLVVWRGLLEAGQSSGREAGSFLGNPWKGGTNPWKLWYLRCSQKSRFTKYFVQKKTCTNLWNEVQIQISWFVTQCQKPKCTFGTDGFSSDSPKHFWWVWNWYEYMSRSRSWQKCELHQFRLSPHLGLSYRSGGKGGGGEERGEGQPS